MQSISKSIHTLSQFIALSFVTTLLLLTVFFFLLGMPDNFMALLYMVTIPTYYYYLILVLSFSLLPLLFIPYLSYLVIIPKLLFDIFLLTDIFVFNVYRFHIDMMFINMAIHDFNGLGLSPVIMAISAFSFLIILAVNLWFYRKAKTSQLINIGKLNLGLLFIFISGQLIHIWGYGYKQEFITKYTPFLPYYFPVMADTFKNIERNHPGIIPAPAIGTDTDMASALREKSDGGSLSNYPSKPITFDGTVKEKPNILFFVVESWRADMLTPEITPNIAQLSDTGYLFTNHFSGGNVTVTGLFSLMYGLHPSYMRSAQSAPHKYQTLFVRSLKDRGYSVEAYTSSNLDTFNMKAMFFGNIPAEAYKNERGSKAARNDRHVVTELVDSIQEVTDTPWFKFVFLTSSHHRYDYPPEYEKYTPVPKNSEAFLFNKNTNPQPFLNDYKNSLRYVDALFGEIWETLKQTGLDKNTVIVVTSDHGEEFNDNGKGYWGHGSNFTRYQTLVPLVISLPGNNKHHSIEQRSGHVDIAPTLLTRVLGSTNAYSDFSSGQDLFNLPDKRGLILTSYKDKAYLIGDNVYATGLFVESYNVNNINTKNNDYEYTMINALRKDGSRFE